MTHDHYACTRCGLLSNTNDLAVIGRNCPAADFTAAHDMQPTEDPEHAAARRAEGILIHSLAALRGLPAVRVEAEVRARAHDRTAEHRDQLARACEAMSDPRAYHLRAGAARSRGRAAAWRAVVPPHVPGCTCDPEGPLDAAEAGAGEYAGRQDDGEGRAQQ